MARAKKKAKAKKKPRRKAQPKPAPAEPAAELDPDRPAIDFSGGGTFATDDPELADRFGKLRGD